MFCPKCGQQQVSDEMRFCSRCGFQLGVVTALIAGGGLLPETIATDIQDEKQLIRRRGIQQGAKLMFASVVLLPIAAGFSILFDSPVPFFIPLTVFLAGLVWMLYFKLFGEETSLVKRPTSPAQLGTNERAALPASHSIPASDFRMPASTAEIVQPPSVTEHTTKLLDN